MLETILSTPIYQVMLAIVGVLSVATAIALPADRRRPANERPTELWLRVRSWWLMAAVFFTAVALDRRLSLVFLGAVSFLALKEFFGLIPFRPADRRAMFWAYLAIPAQYLIIGLGNLGLFFVFVPVWMFLLLPARLVATGETHGFIRSVGLMHWGMMTAAFGLGHGAALLVLPATAGTGLAPSEGIEAAGLEGAGLLLLLATLTQANDVFQYVTGRAFGGAKVIPAVSPGKTWSGVIGGVVLTAALSALLGPLLSPMNVWVSAAVGGVLAFCGFVGDITISAVKRDLGVKDTGKLLPGHGGVLDRVDSLTFTAPVFFHVIRVMCYA